MRKCIGMEIEMSYPYFLLLFFRDRDLKVNIFTNSQVRMLLVLVVLSFEYQSIEWVPTIAIFQSRTTKPGKVTNTAKAFLILA